MNTVTRFLTIIGLTALPIFLAVWAGGAIYDRRQAETVICGFQNLDTAGDPTAASLSFIRRYSTNLTEKNCESDSCQYTFRFANTFLSKLRLARRVDITIYITVDHGSVPFASIEYTSGVFKENSPIIWVQEDFCSEVTSSRCDYFYLDPHGHNVAETWHGNVQFAQMATQDQKRAAKGLNVSCVTAYRGCRDISELLPTVWKLTSSGAVSSRLRSMADSLADESVPLPE